MVSISTEKGMICQCWVHYLLLLPPSGQQKPVIAGLNKLFKVWLFVCLCAPQVGRPTFIIMRQENVDDVALPLLHQLFVNPMHVFPVSTTGRSSDVSRLKLNTSLLTHQKSSVN